MSILHLMGNRTGAPFGTSDPPESPRRKAPPSTTTTVLINLQRAIPRNGVCLEMAREAIAAADPQIDDCGVHDPYELARETLAEEIQAYVQDLLEDSLPMESTFYEILKPALADVDWQAIAESYIDEVI